MLVTSLENDATFLIDGCKAAVWQDPVVVVTFLIHGRETLAVRLQFTCRVAVWTHRAEAHRPATHYTWQHFAHVYSTDKVSRVRTNLLDGKTYKTRDQQEVGWEGSWHQSDIDMNSQQHIKHIWTSLLDLSLTPFHLSIWDQLLPTMYRYSPVW